SSWRSSSRFVCRAARLIRLVSFAALFTRPVSRTGVMGTTMLVAARREERWVKGETMASTHEPVAVLGIGTMGHGMALSALRAGIPTIVWNREPEATRDLAALGAEVAESAAVAARQAPGVGTIVTDACAVAPIVGDQ